MRGADGVMHLYGTDAIAPSLRMPDKTTEALRRNVMATANVLQAAHDARLHKAVYASNAHFYGDHPDIRLTENVTHEPSSPMAASKHMAEQIMHLYTDFFDVRTVREKELNLTNAIFGHWEMRKTILNHAFCHQIMIFSKSSTKILNFAFELGGPSPLPFVW